MLISIGKERERGCYISDKIGCSHRHLTVPDRPVVGVGIVAGMSIATSLTASTLLADTNEGPLSFSLE